MVMWWMRSSSGITEFREISQKKVRYKAAGATDKLHKPEDAGSTLPDVLQACDVIAIK
jgi:hypothetical protein